MFWPNESIGPTQLDAIRELMLAATARGEWLTLAEIAGLTEFGEASISAQLRHLRKPRFGRYRVEKRRRQLLVCAGFRAAAETERADGTLEAPWEYCVFAPAGPGPSGDGVGARGGDDDDNSRDHQAAATPDADADTRVELPLAISFDLLFGNHILGDHVLGDCGDGAAATAAGDDEAFAATSPATDDAAAAQEVRDR